MESHGATPGSTLGPSPLSPLARSGQLPPGKENPETSSPSGRGSKSPLTLRSAEKNVLRCEEGTVIKGELPGEFYFPDAAGAGAAQEESGALSAERWAHGLSRAVMGLSAVTSRP